jgi:nitrogen regulatory protein P-II 1
MSIESFYALEQFYHFRFDVFFMTFLDAGPYTHTHRAIPRLTWRHNRLHGDSFMKRIDAIIRPQNQEQVKEHLAAVGVHGLTVTEIRGFGRQKGHTEVYRGTEYSVDFVAKVMLTVIVQDERVHDIVEAIMAGARTGKMGDGKIFVTPLDEVFRIRTGESGDSAV